MERLGLSKKLLAAIAIIAALSSTNSRADKITLDFEGIGNTAISNFYNGGTDDSGKSGINYGIYFSNDALGLIDTDESPSAEFSGLFANEPSGSTALIFQGEGSATMNVAAGFDSRISFFYSSSEDATVRIFDGLDGTGTELASLNLVTNHKNDNCAGDPSGEFFCHWDKVGVTFNGRAMSVVFDGVPASTFYDDITLGSDVVAPPPPERDLLSECKKDFLWHKRNRRFIDDGSTLDHAALHSECKVFRWYRQWHRRNRHSRSFK
jgi:hypothetical protein